MNPDYQKAVLEDLQAIVAASQVDASTLTEQEVTKVELVETEAGAWLEIELETVKLRLDVSVIEILDKA